MGVIHPVSGQVLEDFLGQLGEVTRGLVEVYTIGANMNSADEVREVIVGIEGFDVVVVIRGGGAPTDFEVLNNVGLLQVWMDKDAYTISAIGHAGNSTLLDTVSDTSCETPTAAGAYLRESALAASGPVGSEREGEAEWLRTELSRYKRNVALLGAVAIVLVVLLVVQSAST